MEPRQAGAGPTRTPGWARGRRPSLPSGSPLVPPFGLRLRLGVKIISVNFGPIPRIFPEVNF